jgi:mannose-6-phosphate isomerase-like protein (cupin superfamily)
MRETQTSISVRTAPHYMWGDECDGWHLVRTPGLSVIQERMPPGASELRHRHAVARQFFFVLSGQLVIELEGEEWALDQGIGVEVSPRKAHQVRNVSDAPVEFLVISQPASRGDRELVPTK